MLKRLAPPSRYNPRMARPRIALNAHLLSGAANYRSAGIHGYIYHTLRHLPDAAPDFDFDVYVGAGQPPEHPALHVRPALIPTGNPLWRIVWEQGFAPLHLAARRPVLLHGMGFSLPLIWPGPGLVTIYDMSFFRYPERLTAARRAYLQRVVPLSARRARRVITISESSRREITELTGVPEHRIDLAIPGVGEQFRPLPADQVETFRREAGLPAHFILCVATLEPRKNLATLLQAFARIDPASGLRLVLAGAQGWQTDPLYGLIATLNLQERVLMPGFVPHDALPLWYNAADLFAYPSIYEGFGLPVLEAMACGLPVLASDSSSLPEALGPDGLLLPPDDPAAWAQSIEALLASPERRADLRARGLARAARFTWAETARATAQSYRRALG